MNDLEGARIVFDNTKNRSFEHVELKGTTGDLVFSFSMITRHLHEECNVPKEILEFCFEEAFKSEEELEKTSKELNKKVLEKALARLFNDVLSMTPDKYKNYDDDNE